MAAVLEIEPELRAELEKLARSTHRDQSDLANEAIRLYVEHEVRMLENIRAGLVQAERGDFVPDEEIDAFFLEYAAPETR